MFNINKGHLIDCRSYRASAAPLFCAVPAGHGKPLGDATALLGLMAGHFDDWWRPRSRGHLGTVRTPVNTGVGIVVPAEAITDALNLDELVELRERRPSAPPVPR